MSGFDDEIIELAEREDVNALDPLLGTSPSGPEADEELEAAIHAAVLESKERKPNKHKKPKKSRPPRPTLSVEQVLAWVDAHHSRTGEWPNEDSGPVADSPTEKWKLISGALRHGLRGLPANSSLAILLDEHRGVRNRNRRDKLLTEEQILEWADIHYAQTGVWPRSSMDSVPGDSKEVWRSINTALRRGTRGLPGGSSIVRLLAEKRGAVSLVHGHRMTEEEILSWAKAWYAKHGNWPMELSGNIPEAPSFTWKQVHRALKHGTHQLPGGSSLPKLLMERLGVKRKPDRIPYRPPRIIRPELSLDLVLHWAKCHCERTGRWPRDGSGHIPESTNDSWHTVGLALSKGERGLPKSTLKTILNAAFDARMGTHTPLISVEQILYYADAYFATHGVPPHMLCGKIPNSRETWRGIEKALANASRGISEKTTLVQLLLRHRWKEYGLPAPEITEDEILGWADTHHRQTGAWPKKYPGTVPGMPSLSWLAVDFWLKGGVKVTPPGMSGSKGIRVLSAESYASCLV